MNPVGLPPGRRGRLLTGLGLGALVVGAVVWLLAGSSLLAVRTVAVRGAHRVSAAEVRRLAGGALGQPLATLDTAALARRVGGLDGVASVSVRRAWPHGVVVDVRERVAVASVRRGGRWWGLDGSGVVFGPAADVPPTGLRTAALAGPGSGPLVAAVLGALPAAVDAQVRGVTATADGQVQLRLAGGALVVWGGAQAAQQKAQVLAVLLHRPARVYDVSTPDVVTTR